MQAGLFRITEIRLACNEPGLLAWPSPSRPAGSAEAPGSTARRRRVRAGCGRGAPLGWRGRPGQCATFRPAPGRFRPALGAPGVKMTVWSCLCRAASGVEARTDAAGPGNGARQSPRPVGLPPEGPSEAAAPQRRDPNDASRLLRIPAALLRPRPFALARVAGPGRKAWRAEGAPLKPWRSCNNPAHGAGSFPVPVSVGV